jgi:plastocyanin
MSKWLVLVFTALVLVLVGGAVVMKRNEKAVTTESEGVEVVDEENLDGVDQELTAIGEEKEVEMVGSNYKFVPNEVRVKKGSMVRLNFKNDSGRHDFVLDEFEVKTDELGEGEEQEVEFVADKVGSFEFYCSVGNHRQMGMVGRLVVE